MFARLGVKGDVGGPGLAKSGMMRSTGFTMRCTSMSAFTPCLRSASHTRDDGQVGHVMVVHDIEMHDVAPEARTLFTSSPNRAKSADKMDGAIL